MNSHKWESLRSSCSTVARCIRSIVTKSCSMEAGSLNKPVDKQGWRPLHYCALTGNVAVATKLLKLGADPNVASADGWTPLHNAAFGGHTDMVECLLSHKAKPTLKDKFGERASDKAKKMRFLILAERLLTAELPYDAEMTPSPRRRNSKAGGDTTSQPTAALIEEMQLLDKALTSTLSADIDSITQHFEQHVNVILKEVNMSGGGANGLTANASELRERNAVEACLAQFLEHEERAVHELAQFEEWVSMTHLFYGYLHQTQMLLMIDNAGRTLLTLEASQKYEALWKETSLGQFLWNFQQCVLNALTVQYGRRAEKRETTHRVLIEEELLREHIACFRQAEYHQLFVLHKESFITVRSKMLLLEYELSLEAMTMNFEEEYHRLEIVLTEQEFRELWFSTFVQDEEHLHRVLIQHKESTKRDQIFQFFSDVHGRSRTLQQHVQKLQMMTQNSVDNVVRTAEYWKWVQRSAKHKVIQQHLNDRIFIPSLLRMLQGYFFKWKVYGTHAAKVARRRHVCIKWEMRCHLGLRRRYLFYWTSFCVQQLKKVVIPKTGRKVVGSPRLVGASRNGGPLSPRKVGPAATSRDASSSIQLEVDRIYNNALSYHGLVVNNTQNSSVKPNLPPILAPPPALVGPRSEMIHTLQHQADRLMVDIMCSHKHPLRNRRFL